MTAREKITVRRLRRTGDSVTVALDRKWLEERGVRIGEDDAALFYGQDEIIIQPLTEAPPPQAATARAKEGSA